MQDFKSNMIAILPAFEYLAFNLLVAIVILILGWGGSILVGKWVRKLFLRSRRIDPTVVPIVQTTVVWVIRICVVVAVLARFGVQTTSLIAVLGAAGLAVGLALQGTLQNVAAGIMLLALRPLRAGESVSIVGKADGTVEEIGLFLTRLVQSDGTYITLPNSLVWGNPIINFSRNAVRRMDVEARVRYGDDLDLALSTLRKLVETHPLALRDPKPQVMVTGNQESVIVINLRVWAAASNFWELRFDLQRRAPEVLRQAGLSLPIPVREQVQSAALAAAQNGEDDAQQE